MHFENNKHSLLGGAKQSFDKFTNKTFGRMMTSPMTREESVKILGIESTLNKIEDDIDPKAIMDRFEELFAKNDPQKGGSFYLQSKIYFAKEFLMQDHPAELNISKHNPTDEPDSDEEEMKEADPEKEESKSDSKKKYINK